MKTRHPLATGLFAVLLLGLATAGDAAATTWLVPGDGSNTCTTGSPNCDTLAQAVTASSANDTISIAAGSFPVAGTQILDKTLTIEGAGIASTTLQPTAGITLFSIQANDIVLRDFTIQNGAVGAAFQSTGSDNTEFARVAFSGQTARGIDVSTNAVQPVTDVRVIDCSFATPNIGIRMASTSDVTTFNITGSTFTNNQYGVYQANDGNTSRLSGLTVDGSTFIGNVPYGLYLEELRDSTIEDSTFTGNGNGIQIFKIYGSALPVANVTIQRNDFSSNVGNPISIYVIGDDLESAINIADNTIGVDVGVQNANRAGIFTSLGAAFTHAPVNITGNAITLSGTFGATTAAHGIRVQGNGPFVITDNDLDGGLVGGSATTPPTSGVYIQSRSTGFPSGGDVPSTATFTASCNRIGRFINGVSVYDTVGAAFGGLPAGTTVSFENNVIAGNTGAGAVNGATPVLDFENDWWGCVAGPGNPGCDAIVGGIDASPVALAPPACVDCQVDAQCDDGLFCNGAETCNTGTSQCVPSTDPCTGGPVCENICNETANDCVTPPAAPCRTAAPTKSQLALKNKTPDTKDQAQWKWSKGAITPKGDFGTPLSSTSYQFCLYANGTLVSGALIPAGGMCGTKPCWKENAKGFQYKNKAATPDGVTQLSLKEGLIAGKAQIQLKAKGDNINMPTMPLVQPVRALIRNSNGVCWETIHSAPASKNDTVQFKDKND